MSASYARWSLLWKMEREDYQIRFQLERLLISKTRERTNRPNPKSVKSCPENRNEKLAKSVKYPRNTEYHARFESALKLIPLGSINNLLARMKYNQRVKDGFNNEMININQALC